MNYANNNTMTISKLVGFAAAVVMTVAVNGSLLWGANDLSKRGTEAPSLMASAERTTPQVVLPAVTIHARKA